MSNGCIRKIQGFLFFVLLLFFWLACETAQAQESSEKGLSLLEAVRTTLVNDPNIHLQEKNVEISKGKLQIAKGQFDAKLESSLTRSRDNLPLTVADETLYGVSQQVTDTTALELGVSKQFRSGVSINPGIEVTKSDNPDDDDEPANRAEFSLVMQLPLLKGRGIEAAGADEMAAKIDYEASILDLRHTISERILSTALSYWNYLAAGKSLDILKESESRARILVRGTEILIKAGELPAADIKQLLANLANRTAARIRGEQTLLEERQTLGLAMGLPFDEISSLPLPSDKFPEIGGEVLSEKVSTFIDEAIKRRVDFQASKKREKSAKVLLEASKRNLKPQLDLFLDFGYAGLCEGEKSEDFFDALNSNESDLNVSAGIGGEWPIDNNSYRGVLTQLESLHQQCIIETKNLARNISSNVFVAGNALRNGAEELMNSEKAVLLYKTAVDNEKEKFKLGTSTLIDVVTTEDRLTGALIDRVSGQLEYASALVNLRFKTGTILSSQDEEICIENLTDIPFKKNVN